jgi:hypothetical protein
MTAPAEAKCEEEELARQFIRFGRLSDHVAEGGRR